MARVFVIDDDAAMRRALCGLLGGAGLEVAAYPDGRSFLAACCGADPEGCVVLDLAMPGMGGREVQEELLAAGLDLPIIFLTGQGDVVTAVETLRAGAEDFVEKPVQGSDLLERVRRALELDRRRSRDREELNRVRQRYATLRPREREILPLVVNGLSNKQIARRLELSYRTVEHHRARLMHRMGAASLAELIRMALYVGA